jgi:hypothetical protein
LEIDYFGRRMSATVIQDPPYDSTMSRLDG